MEVFPNPAMENITVALNGYKKVNGTIRIVDAIGKIVLTEKIDNLQHIVNFSQLANWMYILVFDDEENSLKLQTRLMILK